MSDLELEEIGLFISEMETKLANARKKRAHFERTISKRANQISKQIDSGNMSQKQILRAKNVLSRAARLLDKKADMASLEEVKKMVDEIYGDQSDNQTYYFTERQRRKEEKQASRRKRASQDLFVGVIEDGYLMAASESKRKVMRHPIVSRQDSYGIYLLRNVPDELAEKLKAYAMDGGQVGMPDGYAAWQKALPYMDKTVVEVEGGERVASLDKKAEVQEGDRVKITGGSKKGLIGTVREVTRDRVKVVIGNEVHGSLLTIDKKQVRPVEVSSRRSSTIAEEVWKTADSKGLEEAMKQMDSLYGDQSDNQTYYPSRRMTDEEAAEMSAIWEKEATSFYGVEHKKAPFDNPKLQGVVDLLKKRGSIYNAIWQPSENVLGIKGRWKDGVDAGSILSSELKRNFRFVEDVFYDSGYLQIKLRGIKEARLTDGSPEAEIIDEMIDELISLSRMAQSIAAHGDPSAKDFVDGSQLRRLIDATVNWLFDADKYGTETVARKVKYELEELDEWLDHLENKYPGETNLSRGGTLRRQVKELEKLRRQLAKMAKRSSADWDAYDQMSDMERRSDEALMDIAREMDLLYGDQSDNETFYPSRRMTDDEAYEMSAISDEEDMVDANWAQEEQYYLTSQEFDEFGESKQARNENPKELAKKVDRILQRRGIDVHEISEYGMNNWPFWKWNRHQGSDAEGIADRIEKAIKRDYPGSLDKFSAGYFKQDDFEDHNPLPSYRGDGAVPTEGYWGDEADEQPHVIEDRDEYLDDLFSNN